MFQHGRAAGQGKAGQGRAVQHAKGSSRVAEWRYSKAALAAHAAGLGQCPLPVPLPADAPAAACRAAASAAHSSLCPPGCP